MRRSFFSSSLSLLRRPLAILADSRDDLFNFTSECVSLITIANISDCNLYPSATSRLFAIRNGASFSMSTGYVNLQLRPSTKVSLMSSKFAEADSIGHFITLRDGQMVSQVPYPMTVPKYYAIASEVATIEYMCSFLLPVPNIYGYLASVIAQTISCTKTLSKYR